VVTNANSAPPYPHVLHRVPDRWGRGPTTLLGDAAHAFRRRWAQGANQALEDAWLLRRAPGRRRRPGSRAARLRAPPRPAGAPGLPAGRRAGHQPPVRPAGRRAHPPGTAAAAGRLYAAIIRSWSDVLAAPTRGARRR
jgi:FAD-dependent urate hydroxylase